LIAKVKNKAEAKKKIHFAEQYQIHFYGKTGSNLYRT